MADDVKYLYHDRLDSSLLTFDGNEIVDSGVAAATIIHRQKHFSKIYFTKNLDYRDEAEFRVVVLDETESREFTELPVAGLIKGVILGDRFPDAYLPIAKSLQLNYETRRLKWNNGRYFELRVESV